MQESTTELMDSSEVQKLESRKSDDGDARKNRQTRGGDLTARDGRRWLRKLPGTRRVTICAD